MSKVSQQYEAFPYPERDPRDEKKRLITGSPSHPLEIDHYLFAGHRDWSQPLRALVAGGGTGDALIQLAQVLTSAGKPYEITYLDLSTASRAIAEERARVRGLKGIRFETGSLLDAGDYGAFDYIDCCGVLHHLPDPQAGFDALAGALAPGGGIGLMVYAPYGRAGVYPLQEAFGALLQGPPAERLKQASEIFDRLPETHPFKRNPHLVDHRASDAGFYDLLLHSQDRAFSIRELVEAMAAAGLELAGLPQAHLYDPAPLVGEELLADLDAVTRMELAEKLRGSIKLHVAYCVRTGDADKRVAKPADWQVPHLKGVDPRALAQAVSKKGEISLTLEGGEKARLTLGKAVAPLLAKVSGRANLGEVAQAQGLDPMAFAAIWNKPAKALADHGLLYYSGLLR